MPFGVAGSNGRESNGGSRTSSAFDGVFFDVVDVNGFAEMDVFWGCFHSVPKDFKTSNILGQVIWDGPGGFEANEEFRSFKNDGDGWEFNEPRAGRDKFQSVNGATVASAPVVRA